MIEEVNSDIFLRPRFKIDLNESKEVLLQKFKGNLNANNCKYCSKIVDNHIFIDVPFEEDHFWTPQLHLEIISENEDAAFVKGLFGPKPQVWTLFMFLHFVVGISFLVFLVMLYVNWSLKESLFISTLMVVFLPIIWIALYVFGRLGRKKGKTQMVELHQFMLKILNKG